MWIAQFSNQPGKARTRQNRMSRMAAPKVKSSNTTGGIAIMLEQEKKEKNLKLWRIARHGADAAADGGDAVCAARSAGHYPGALGRGRLARPLWQPVGAAAPRRDRAVSGNFAAARFFFPASQGDAATGGRSPWLSLM